MHVWFLEFHKSNKASSYIQNPNALFLILEYTLQAVDCEEDFLVAANSDIAQLCAENILLWQHFLSVVMSSEPVRQHLARQHHMQRVSDFRKGCLWDTADGGPSSSFLLILIILRIVFNSKFII